MTEGELFRPLPEDVCSDADPIDPFRYVPHRAVIAAARCVIKEISAIEDGRVSHSFSEGKMLGVLVAEDENGRKGCFAGFSGNVGGKNLISGFVPPVYDLLNPDGHFRQKEAEITEINRMISEMQKDVGKDAPGSVLSMLKQEMEKEILAAKAAAKSAKQERDTVRKTASDASVTAELDRQSQFIKAELRRLKATWREKINAAQEELAAKEAAVKKLESRRAAMSDALQKWIFSQYRVHNSTGEECTVSEIFIGAGSVPPGGTGECAAPKLLEYAYRNGFHPVAMGEFWYGKSPDTAVRTHGHFYPSCTSKCGPLLNFMLGSRTDAECGTASGCKANSGNGRPEIFGKPVIIYDDDVITVVSKPSGMPSVKGLAARLSLEEWLGHMYASSGKEVIPYTVHRLDMDTSGVMLFAKSPEAASALMKQFEERSVSKTYMARLSAADPASLETEGFGQYGTGVRILKKGDCGIVSLPLSPDYDERPRQKADKVQGKEAVTEYEVTGISPDGSAEVLFYPKTGRTHQLRVHSAHVLGLGRPIKGDLLYGGYSVFDDQAGETRLCLHAVKLTFRHPADGKEMTFTSTQNSY